MGNEIILKQSVRIRGDIEEHVRSCFSLIGHLASVALKTLVHHSAGWAFRVIVMKVVGWFD